MNLSSTLRSLFLTGLTSSLLFGSASALPTQDTSRTVHITHAKRTTIDRSAKLVGSVLPWQAVTLKARVTGYVNSVAVMPGDRLSKGDVVCALDLPSLHAMREAADASLVEAQARVLGRQGDIEAASADVIDAQAAERVAISQILVQQAAVAVADAEVNLAQTAFARTRSLHEAKAATQEDLDQAAGELARANASHAAAEADVSMARAQLEAAQARTMAAQARVKGAEAQVAAAEAGVKTAAAKVAQVASEVAFGDLHCPFDNALVTERLIDPGALALANQTGLVTLMDVSKVRMQFHVPERISRIVKPGTRVVLTMDDSSGETIEGSVARTTGALAHDSRTMRAEVDLDNEAGNFYPGMFFHARVTVEEIANAMVLPGSAVHTQRKQNYVLVVNAGGMVERINVKLGVDDGRRVQVLEGLDGTERVVMSLVAGLREGDRVDAVEGK